MNHVVLKGLVASEKYPLVYLNMPKSGCTTVKNLLYFLDHGTPFEDVPAIHQAVNRGEALLSASRPGKLAQAMRNRRLCFTLVRHPLRRAYSSFNEKIVHQTPYGFPGVRMALQSRRFKARFPEPGQAYSVDQHAANFAIFLRFVRLNLKRLTRFKPNTHWQPQWDILSLVRRKTEVDFVGRVERIRADLELVMRAAGVPRAESIPIARHNTGPPPPFAYEEVLSPQVLQLGKAIYAADFRHFAYPLEPAPC